MLLLLASSSAAPLDETLVIGERDVWLVHAAPGLEGGVIAAGRSSAEGQAYPLLVALDASGEPLWGHEEEYSGHYTAVSRRGDRVAACGAALGSASLPILWLSTDDGEVIRDGVVGEVSGECFDIHWVDDDTVLLAGFGKDDGPEQPWLMWWSVEARATTREVRLDRDTRFLSATPLPDGGFLAAGYEDEGGAAAAWLARFDSEGVIIWDHFLGVEGDDNRLKIAALTDDGDVVACGYTVLAADRQRQAWIGRWSPEGEARWTLTPGGAGEEGFKDMTLGDGWIHVVGDSTNEAGDWDLYAANISVDGALGEEFFLDKGGDDLPYKNLTLSTGERRYVGTRWVAHAGDEGKMAGWILPAFPQGPPPWGDTAGDTAGDTTGDSEPGVDSGDVDSVAGGDRGDRGDSGAGGGDAGAEGWDAPAGACGCRGEGSAGLALPLLLALRRRSALGDPG